MDSEEVALQLAKKGTNVSVVDISKENGKRLLDFVGTGR